MYMIYEHLMALTRKSHHLHIQVCFYQLQAVEQSCVFGAYWLNAKSFDVLQAKKKLGAEISEFHRQKCVTHSYPYRT